MVEEIKIQNLTTNAILTLNRTNSDYLLDDNSPDWGTVSAEDITYPLMSSGIGIGVTKTVLNSPRPVTIIGWIYNSPDNTIENKKKTLNSFCNPFDELEIRTGEYEIRGHFSQPILYSASDDSNNECICKFILYITCQVPMFNKISRSNTTNRGELQNSFMFPLVLPELQTYIFGYRIQDDTVILNNTGTVASGMIIELKTASSVQGLSLSIGNQEFSLKPSYILVPGVTIRINTISGSRGIWTKSGSGDFEYAFQIIDLDSDWLQAPVGLNELEIVCDEGSISALSVDVKLEELFYAMENQ